MPSPVATTEAAVAPAAATATTTATATSASASAAASPSRRKRRRYLIWCVVLLAFAGLFWWALRKHEGTGRPMAPAPVTVVVATAQTATVPVYLDAIGTVTPVHTALITSQVTGQLTSVRYQEGQLVRRGMLLVEIDPRPFAATLLQAQGALERDTQLLAQAQMDLERYRAAWAKNAIPKQLLDDQEKLALQIEGTVKNDRGIVRFDEIQLGFCRISAPFTGRVGLRLVDPGNVVNTTSVTTLAVLTQLRPITVVFTISEDDLGQVLEHARQGAPLRVQALDRMKSRTLASGALISIDNQIDTTTGTVKLRALFDNEDEALFPNLFVNTRLLVRTIDGATTVPAAAVQHNGKQAYVYVIRNARAHVQPVTIGVSEGHATQIEEGVAPGTVVAVSSFQKLQDGAAVAIGKPVTVPDAAGQRSAPP
jgi:multidrug efflux system membrane fusion protein